MPKERPPVFHRRVSTVAEMQAALTDACRAVDLPPGEVKFSALVRIDLTDSQVLLSILGRNL